jgi:hypothetical protein
LVLEATPNGLGEVSDDRLVLAPVVRQELLTGSKNVVVEPVKRIALGLPVEQRDRDPRARPYDYEDQVEPYECGTRHASRVAERA